MFGFFGKKDKNSGAIANNRLKVVITQDRASISQDVLECLLKNEEERNVGLSISIPVKKVKKRVNVFDED
jgi:septum formation topological specificity factor MinE